MPTWPPLPGETIGILIVTEEPLLAMDTAEIFALSGMAVSAAGDADEALALLSDRDGIPVLIVDLALSAGTMGGCALVRTIARRWPEVGVLVLSGGDRPELGALPAGVCFLPKPCRGWDLVRSALAILARRDGEHPKRAAARRPVDAREEAWRRRRILANDILVDTALAREVATIAEASERRGRVAEADALRAIARGHRIRILEAQGRLAALSDRLA